MLGTIEATLLDDCWTFVTNLPTAINWMNGVLGALVIGVGGDVLNSWIKGKPQGAERNRFKIFSIIVVTYLFIFFILSFSVVSHQRSLYLKLTPGMTYSNVVSILGDKGQVDKQATAAVRGVRLFENSNISSSVLANMFAGQHNAADGLRNASIKTTNIVFYKWKTLFINYRYFFLTFENNILADGNIVKSQQ